VPCARSSSLAPADVYSLQTARAADGTTTTITSSCLPGRLAEGPVTITTYPDGINSTAFSSGRRVAVLPGIGTVISYVSRAWAPACLPATACLPAACPTHRAAPSRQPT
jgi:hypothetical protein